MSESKFLLPDVGEGLTEAEIVSWRVAVGETVVINQVLVEIETAKSLVELPSPFAGVVGNLLVSEGDTVEVGTPIITIGDGAPEPATPGVTDADSVAQDVATTISPERGDAVLVGRGSVGTMPSRRKHHAQKPVAHETLAQSASPTAGAAAPAASAAPAAAIRTAPEPIRPAAGHPSAVLAKPPVRKLAKDLGVDLTAVSPTGPIGDITREDVTRSLEQVGVFRNIETPQWPESREDRIPVKGVRKAIAQAMVTSAFSAPHVGVFVDVDATRTMEFVKRLKNSADFAGVKVSPMLIMAKAMIWAVRRNPTVNSTWTDEEIIVRHYVNLGFAAATPRGLVVPNIKEAQSMSLLELAKALEATTNTARDGKLAPKDMSGGTITITNIGVFGMDTGTPILNPGEVGIVALGTIKQKPWVVDGEVRARWVTTLGASFDHRVVDGDVASRFLADVAAIIEEPALLLE